MHNQQSTSPAYFSAPHRPAVLYSRAHTLHSAPPSPTMQEAAAQTHPEIPSMMALDVLAKAASQRASLSRDDTAADVSLLHNVPQQTEYVPLTAFEKWYRAGSSKSRNIEEARTEFSQKYRTQNAAYLEGQREVRYLDRRYDQSRRSPTSASSVRNPSIWPQEPIPWGVGARQYPWPAPSTASDASSISSGASSSASSETGRRGSLGRRLHKKMEYLGHNLRRRSTTSPDFDQPQEAYVDPAMLTLSKPQPTSPVKRNGKHGDDRPRKFRGGGSFFSADRKDTPAPPFGQQSRVAPPFSVPNGGQSARQAAARLNTFVPNFNTAAFTADFYNQQDDIHSQRSRLGSIPSAADSGADLSTYARFDTPERDCDGDVVMATEKPARTDRIDFVAGTLPDELKLHIFSLLDAKSLCGTQQVNRSWNAISKDDSIWRTVFLRRYQRQVHTDPAPVQVGGVGIGQPNVPKQEWKRMYRARAILDKQWRMGAKKAGKATYLSGHTDSVYCVQFDEEKIITGSRDRTIRVWDINTNQCIRVIGGPHVRPVPGPKPLRTTDYPHFHSAVASVNGTTYGNSIYHVPSEWHDASILCLQYDSKVLVTGSSDSDLLVWDINTYEPIRRLRAHTGGVLDVALDSRHIVSCSKDSKIIVWDRETYEPKGTLCGHRGPVNAVQLRGRFLVSASGDGIARLWDIEAMKLVKEFSAKERGLAAVEFSEDMKYVLAGGNDHITYKFDVETGDEVKQFKGHTQLVRSLWLDSANDRVVSGSYDLDLRVYDFNTGDEIWRAEEWTTSWMLAAKSDYRRIVATSQDGRILLIDFGLRKDYHYDGCPIEGVDLLREIPIEQTTAIIFRNPWE